MIKTEETQKFDQCIGEVLRDIRVHDTGLTQGAMAAKINLTQPTISAVEAGKVSASVYLLYLYCKAAGIEPTDVIERIKERIIM